MTIYYNFSKILQQIYRSKDANCYHNTIMDFKYMMFYYTPLNLEDFKETSFDPDQINTE